MCKLTAVVACILMLCAVLVISDFDAQGEDVGQVPEVVVTAEHYDVGEREWAGLMDTVLATGVQYDHTDPAWYGLTDTVTVVEERPLLQRGTVMRVLTYRGPWSFFNDDFYHRVE
jgi:hypothetical protein